MTEISNLEPADLNVSLNFPEGDRLEVARLTITDRKSNLVVAEINFSAEDLVNFYARRATGPMEGETSLINPAGRACLNQERQLVSVRVPREASDTFKDDESRNLAAWASDAVKAFGASGYRIVVNRGGETLSLVFYAPTIGDREMRYFQVIQQKLRAAVDVYVEAAAQQRNKELGR